MKTYGRNTHLGFIADLCEQGKSQDEAYRILLPMVERQMEPMIFTRNPDRAMGETHRMPKPMLEQLTELRNAIGRIYSEIERSKSGTGSTRQTATIVETETTEETTTTEIVEETTEETKPPVAGGKRRTESEFEKFERRIFEIKSFCDRRAETDFVDEVSLRPFEAAARLIPCGVPADALLSSLSIHWSRDQRDDAGIADFDFKSLSASLASDLQCEKVWAERGQTEPLHEMFGYVLTLALCRQPIYLYGQKGTGKSHIARQISTFLNLPYGETPMSAGASRGDLQGRLTASQTREFIPAKFCEIYGGGGVFNFEEIDAALAELLIVLNNAMAGNHFYNAMSGETLDKHGNFIAVSTANTLSLGANSQYLRERLDAATLDRWNMGRVPIDFDPAVAKFVLHRKNHQAPETFASYLSEIV
jgi:AAA domain (dynein-related subfamily)